MLAYAEFQADPAQAVPHPPLAFRPPPIVQPVAAPFGQRDAQFARTAWAYFQAFHDPKTGLSPTTSTISDVSIYEVGATLLAITAADLLGLITTRAAAHRVSRLLRVMSQIPLDKRGLPIDKINISTLRRTGRRADITGLMRLVAGFIVAAHHYPVHVPEISDILNAWNLSILLRKGHFNPALTGRQGEYQTTLGPQQYSARVAGLIGLPVTGVSAPQRIILSNHIHQSQPPQKPQSGATPDLMITSDAIYLEAVEFGWRPEMMKLASTLFLAQRARFLKTGRVTALGSDALDQQPWHATHAVDTGLAGFSCLTPDGTLAPDLATVSTKAAFGWNAIMPGPYATKLVDGVSNLSRPEGWLAGYYEATCRPNAVLSLNTNAEILEALHYRVNGPLFPVAK